MTCPIRTGRSRTRTCRRWSASWTRPGGCSSSERARPALARARRERLLAAGRGHRGAGELARRAHPRGRGGGRVVPRRGARRRVLRARPAARARPRARQRARPERARHLERGAHVAGRIRAGRGRAGGSARLAGRLAVGVPRRRGRADRPARIACAVRRVDRVAARMISEAMEALYAGERERGAALLEPGRESVFEAAAFGRIARLEELLAAEPELVRSWSEDCFTPLHLACFAGRAEATRLLVERRPDLA